MKLSTKSLGIAGGSLVVLGLAAAGWNWHLEKLPTDLEPKPKLPVPNAFDTLVKAAKLMADTREFSDAVARKPLLETKIEISPAKKQALYGRNRKAINLIKTALGQEYCAPPAASTEDSNFFDQNITILRAAQLLILEGQVHETNTDFAKAAKSYLEALQFSRHTIRGRPLIGIIYGEAMEKKGRHNLNAIRQNLNLNQTLTVLRHLQRIENQAYAYADALRSEKAFGQMALLEEMQKPGWRLRWPEEEEFDLSEQPPVTLLTKIKLWQFSNQTILAEYNTYMDNLIEQAKQDYAQQKAIPLPKNPVVNRWALDFTHMQKQSRLNALSNRIGNDFLLITFALYAYQLENKTLPSTLSQLVPQYLSKVPSDLFAPSQQLKYQRKGRGYLLYSVGPDGNDDKGKPIQRKDEEGVVRYLARDDSKGDIVAGIND